MLKRYLKFAALAALTGFLAGSASALFLYLLGEATRFRQEHAYLPLALPIAGLVIGLLYHRFGKDVAAGNSLIIDEIHDPKRLVPLRMAPLILFGTVVTSLFGGSAGREGTAVQMGASLAERLSRFARLSLLDRRSLLVAGMSGGFASALGTPWAGFVFGLEVLYVARLQSFAIVESFIAAMIGSYTVHLWGVHHTAYPVPALPAFTPYLVMSVAIAGLVFGLTSLLFVKVVHSIEHAAKRWISYPPLRPFLGGLVVIAFFYLEGSFRYEGLGLEQIVESLQGEGEMFDPFGKLIATTLTLGSGFKGGEFIPLVFIGASLGDVLGALLHISEGFLAALGFAALFGAAANTPIACAVMGIELFGFTYAPYLAIACGVAYLCSGTHGIYATQRGKEEKYRWLSRFQKPSQR